MQKESTTDENGALVQEIAKRLSSAQSSQKQQYDNMKDDELFYGGDQWDSQVRAMRNSRPSLVNNNLPKFVKRICNVVRMNAPSIKVAPMDGGIDEETAEVFQGIVRNIEAQSDAKTVYVSALEHMCIGGVGWAKLTYEYADDNSMEMDIRIKRVRDPLSVYIDPASIEADGSDMKWAVELEWRSLEELKEQYGNDVTGGDWSAPNINRPQKDGDNVLVAHYWYIEEVSDKLHKLQSGQVIRESEIDPAMLAQMPVIQSRPTVRRKVCWALATSCHVLDKGEWPGTMIPIAPCYGDLVRLTDNTYVYKGIVRDLRDEQRMVNYYASYEAEAMAIAPRSPWIAEETQLGEHMDIWKDSNVRDYTVLPYKMVEGAPPPQRLSAGVDISPIMAARVRAIEDMKETTGIADFGYQSVGNESGRAVMLKRQQQDILIADKSDNLNRMVRRIGQMIVDIAPRVLSDARIARIVGDDESVNSIPINQPFTDDKTGMQRIHRIGVGRYDVTVTTGPAYSTRKQETADAILALVQANPAYAAISGDILAQNIDGPGMDTLAERAKKMLPPELQDQQGAIDPATKAILDQQQQALQQAEAFADEQQKKMEQLMGVIAQLQQQVENKEMQAQVDLTKTVLDNETKERIAKINAGNKLDVEQAKGLTSLATTYAAADRMVQPEVIEPHAHKSIPRTAGPVSASGISRGVVPQAPEGMAT